MTDSDINFLFAKHIQKRGSGSRNEQDLLLHIGLIFMDRLRQHHNNVVVFCQTAYTNRRLGVMFQKVCLFIPIVPDEVIKIAQKIDLDQF